MPVYSLKNIGGVSDEAVDEKNVQVSIELNVVEDVQDVTNGTKHLERNNLKNSLKG